jgi:hypothetical protein
MLLRQAESGIIAIPQPNHAWLSGQLCRAWGNACFAAPTPREDVCLAAGLHDIGWLQWEAAPSFDLQTGLPREFLKVPPPVHTGIWRDGVKWAHAYGRVVALHVSLHADTLYSRFFDFNRATPEDARLVRDFLDEQHGVRAEIIASLRSDPESAADASDQNIECNRLLIAAFDWMSLKICWGIKEETLIPDVPVSADERTKLVLHPRNSEGRKLTVDPWPFTTDEVEVKAEGKLLRGRFSDANEMRQALAEAETVVVKAKLRPV